MASLWYCNVGHGRGEIVDAVDRPDAHARGTTTRFDPFTNEPAEAARPQLLATWPRSPTPGCSSPARAPRPSTRPSSWPASPRSQAGHPERTLIVSRELRLPRRHLRRAHGPGPAGQPGRASGPLLPDFVNLPSDDLEAMADACSPSGATRSPRSSPSRCRAPAACARPCPATWTACAGCATSTAPSSSSTRSSAASAGSATGSAASTTASGPTSSPSPRASPRATCPLGGVIVGRAPSVTPLEADPTFVLRHGSHLLRPPDRVRGRPLATLDITEDDGLFDAGPARRRAPRRTAWPAWPPTARWPRSGARARVGGRPCPRRATPSPCATACSSGRHRPPIGTDTLAFCPPLVITDGEIDRIVDGLAAALK